MQAGAAAWRRVEGIMWGRKLKKQLKGKVFGSLRGTSLYIQVGNSGIDIETGGEDTDSKEQMGPENM